jgi:hypothetical protein
VHENMQKPKVVWKCHIGSTIQGGPMKMSQLDRVRVYFSFQFEISKNTNQTLPSILIGYKALLLSACILFYVIYTYLWSIFASIHPFELPEEKFA